MNFTNILARPQFSDDELRAFGVDNDSPVALQEPDEAELHAPDEGEPTRAKSNKSKSKSQATVLVGITKGIEKWHTPDGTAYVSVNVRQHREHYPIRSTAFRRWLQHQYFSKTKSAANAQAVQDAVGALEGKALFDGREHAVNVRVAEHDGNIFIDLCDQEWRAIEITATGWRVVADSPIRFRRARSMLPLPVPESGGDAAELQHHLGVRADGWPMIAGWLVSAIRPQGPFPVLNLSAEQGAGKTTLARKIRALVDPNSAPMRCEPKEPRDLMIAANNGWVISLDNLSHLGGWLSDALCRLSTGGGFSTRELYTDSDEIIFDAKRPVVINGIEDLATRGDLLDRSLVVNLPTIREAHRRTEAEIWAEFAAVHPRLLGTLFDAVSMALARVTVVTVKSLPRMADFALWSTAAEPALGMRPGEFMSAYAGNRAAGNELAIEASPAGKPLIDFCATTPFWTGTATELLMELDRVADDKLKRVRGWPATGRALAGILKRLAPNLRAVGVDVEAGRTKRGRFITLTRKVPESTVTTVTSVTGPLDTGETGAGGDARVTRDDGWVTRENAENAAGDGSDDEIPSYSAGLSDVWGGR